MKTFIASACLLACMAAHADDSPWRVYAAGGISTGGDTLLRGTMVEQGTSKTVPFEIKPGTGIPVRVGAEYRISAPFAVRGAFERMVTDPSGTNGSVTFTSTSAELMGLFSVSPDIRLGLGVRQTTAVLDGTGVAASWSEVGTYTSAGGAVLEAQYLFSNDPARPQRRQPQVAVTVRLVSESFQRNDVTVNGDHYEVGLALYF